MKISRRKSAFELNNRGSALIFSFLVLSVLLTLSAAFAVRSMTELQQSQRYRDSSAAFWLAEAGINQFQKNTTMLDGSNSTTISLGSHQVDVNKVDSSTKRLVNSIAQVNGVTRHIQIEYAANPPDVFNNAVSAGNNITVNFTSAIGTGWWVTGRTRHTGVMSGTGPLGSLVYNPEVYWNWDMGDYQNGIPMGQTTLTYPDVNSNGIPDEFNDFVKLNKANLGLNPDGGCVSPKKYACSEILYVWTTGTATIIPNEGLAGKKVIFVEGSNSSQGNVNIVFGTTWAQHPDITIIATGAITMTYPKSNNKIHTISWGNYNEVTQPDWDNRGVRYTHSNASVWDANSSDTWFKGSLIANGNIAYRADRGGGRLHEYESMLENGVVPSGFEGMIGTSTTGYASTPSAWREI